MRVPGAVALGTRFVPSGPKSTGMLKTSHHVAPVRFENLWAEGKTGSLGLLERGTLHRGGLCGSGWQRIALPRSQTRSAGFQEPVERPVQPGREACR